MTTIDFTSRVTVGAAGFEPEQAQRPRPVALRGLVLSAFGGRAQNAVQRLEGQQRRRRLLERG